MSFSQDFFEKVLLLILTAGVTGLLIPCVLKIVDERKAQKQKEIDDRRLREQKLYEAALLRQNKIIDAQVQLLDNLANLIWEYQLLAIEVSYFNPIEQSDLYSAAVKEYDKRTGATFAKIRAEISKALYLTSTDTYQELRELYYKKLIPLDMELYRLMKKQRDTKQKIPDWKHFNDNTVHDLGDIIDDTLNNLAKELRLKSVEQK
ncbi:hypothetical protein [Leptolyngbya sp. FACHB-261]|uniref:hypothetical protein n=1 Tax=Leptolyngbya sp. FACHB-261 TaxID=2692806 RepID=UPI0016895F34|nr:hypothetical protein [Leptolyngbya sp. FACHB-261]MBD2103594.1 hypothetical protein [Leptolyngbya sp. FACHB-261]